MRLLAVVLLLGGVFAWQHQGEIRLAWERSRPGYEAPAVVLLATAWCGYCRKMREYFAAEGIAYTEYDIETHPLGKSWFDSLDASGVPVVVIGEEVVYGYDPDGVSAVLASH